MIDNIFGKKIEKIIDYMFVFYMIILFCFDSNEFGVHLVQLTMYIMMILLLVKIYREKKIVYNRPILFLGIFTFFCAITSVFALDPKLAIGRSINIFVKLLFVFLLYNNYHDGKRQKFLVNTFIGAGVVLVLYLIKCYGVFDFFINIFKGKRIYAGVPNNELLLGFPNINTISTISTFSFIFCLYYLFQKKLFYLWPALILSFAIIGGASKSSLLLILAMVIYFMIKNKVVYKIKNKKRFYFIVSTIIIASILSIIFLPIGERIRNMILTIFGDGNDVSTTERILLYQEGFRTFINYPFFGIGLHNSGIVVNELIGNATYFHSDLMELLACTGFFGFVLYVISHCYIFEDHKNDSSREITYVILLCFIMLFPISCIYAMKYRYILLLIAYTGVCEKEIIIPEKLLHIIGKIFDWRTYVFFFKKIGLLNFLSDESCIKLLYLAKMNKKLDLNNPKTYNEKIQWLKLYDRRDIYIKMVDKHDAKEYVENIIGKHYIIPTIGLYNSFEEIDFDKLPNQFVIKTTHDSGGVVVVKNKNKFLSEEYENGKNKINNSLKNNYYYYWREWPYKNVKPRVIVEKYIEDKNDHELRDYKFFCFNGKVKIMFVASNRQGDGDTYFDFFDRKYNHLDIINGHPNAPTVPHKPKNYDLMIDLSEKLSKGFPHIRVDFYEKDGKVYFGELTLYHWSGLVPIEPEEWDYKMGEWIDLKKIK